MRATEQLQSVYDRIDQLEPQLHSLLTVVRGEASKVHGPLDGMAATIKDVIVTKDIETTAGSKMLKGWVPPYDATVVARLKAAGVTIVGKNNCDAWAHGSSTENSDFGPSHNPWDLERVPGGSSGGSAAAVAAQIGDFSIGTDTGGSIRQPAALCGVTGLKPTYGRVSRYGLIAMASSLDCPGPFARDAETAARVLEVIAGKDPLDATTVPTKPFSAAAVTSPAANPDKPLAGLRVGVPKEYFAEGLHPEIAQAVRGALTQLEQLGATLIDIELPSTPYALATYYIIQPAEVSSNLARFDGVRYGHSVPRNDKAQMPNAKLSAIDLVKQNRAEGFGAEAKRRIILGTFVLSAGYVDAYYKKALRVRTLLRSEFSAAFNKVDIIAAPTTPNPAFKLGEKVDDPLALYLEDVYTVSANLTGNPGVSIPCGFTANNLPIGLQLFGPMFGEEAILRTAHIYQQATDWHKRRPNIAMTNS